MKRFFKYTAIVILIVTAFFGWSLWAMSAKSPYFVAASYDFLVRSVSGYDLATRCSRWEGKNYRLTEERGCYIFLPPREYSGVYFDEVEGQIFLENVSPAPKMIQKEDVWLTFDETSDQNGMSVYRDRKLTQVWLIKFIGRETAYKGLYGHGGGSSKEILVDKVLEARLLKEGEGYLSQDMVKFAD